MQAGFPVAPQAPVATQPRQMVQPLPTGAERTPVVVPQFDAALSNVMMNRGSTDQATVPAAQSAASERRPGCRFMRDREPQPPRQCRWLDCRLRRSIHPLERSQPRERTQPSAVPRRPELSLRPAPLRRSGDGPDPDRRGVGDAASEHCRRCRATGRRWPPIAGGQTARGHRRCTQEPYRNLYCIRRPARRARCFPAAIHCGGAAGIAPCDVRPRPSGAGNRCDATSNRGRRTACRGR